MARYALLLDVGKCSGCYNCFMACKDEHCGNENLPIAKKQPEMGHYWMNLVEKERGQYPKVKVASIPLTCMQCEDAACIAQARDGAVYRRSDGIVIIDPVKSKGQRQLVDACHYGVVYWNEAEDIPQKCTLCAHLIDRGWKEPRCVEACPTDALVFGDVDDPGSEIARGIATGKAEALYPEKKSRPANLYIGLPKKFLAGTLHYAEVEECAENVRVKLSGNGFSRETITNAFGDFEFEDLPDDLEWQISITKPGYQDQKISVTCDNDLYLGKILLQSKQ